MKNDLTCGVVRDLLPSYVEGLVGEESRQAVDKHLVGCPDCAAQRDAMSAPAEETAEETAKEVDYLKKVKKRSAKRITLAVVCTALALVGAFLTKEFIIGRVPDPEMISIDCTEVDAENNLTLLADTYWGAYELRGLKATEKDGVLTYTAREVRVNIFQDLFMQDEVGGMSGYWKQIPLTIPLDGLTEVWICGRLVWQDGVAIDHDTLRLLDAKTPYCGDASALGRIADILNIWNLGPYTTELQTSEEPYCWTLNFSEQFRSNPKQFIMARNEYLMLALVDNLEKAAYTLPDIQNTYEDQEATGWCTGGYLTKDQADQGIQSLTEKYNSAHRTAWEAKESIKDYTQSPADFQRLIDILNWNYLKWES